MVIHGRDRTIRTDACWSPNPNVRRVSSKFLDNVWTVSCRTSPDDPKEEHGEYTLRAEGATRLHYKDVSHYDWELKRSNCVATIVTTQTLSRVRDGAQAPPPEEPPEPPQEVSAAPQEPEPEPEAPCTPGAPQKLVLRPKWVQLEPGQRACLRARAVDGLGCTVPDQPVTWSLRHLKGLRAQLQQNGCFVAADDAAEAEGEFRVIAVSGGLREQALISVSPADLSGIIARRIESGAVSGFAQDGTKARPSESDAAARSASSKLEVKSQGGSDALWTAIAAVLVLGLLGVLLWLRRRPQRPAAEAGSGEEAVAPTPSPVSSEPPAPSAEQWICPACRRGYPREKRVCPLDSAELVPYQQFAEEHRALQQRQLQKRCPKCGAIYPAAASFCARDGTGLVSPD